MAIPNSAWDPMITTTLNSRSGVLADNLSKNNVLLKELKKKGNVKTVSGGLTIVEELIYDDPNTSNVNSYSGWEQLSTKPNSPITAAEFAFTQYATSVSISGLEQLQNAGDQQVIDLLESRINIMEIQMMNRMDYDMYQDGTGNGGKNITGLAAMIPSVPTSGIYGGIDRSVWDFWRPQVYSGVTDGGAAVSEANIIKYMTSLALRLVRNNDMPRLILAGSTYYEMYVNALQAIQRVTTSENAAAGFASLKFFGGGTSADVVLGGGIGGNAPSTQMRFLNLNWIKFRPHSARNFTPIGGERQPINQDGFIKFMGWAGNMTCIGPQFQGLLKA